MATLELPLRSRLPCTADDASKGDHQELHCGSDGEQNDKGRELADEHQEPYAESASINEIEDQDGGVVHSVSTVRLLVGVLCGSPCRFVVDERLGGRELCLGRVAGRLSDGIGVHCLSAHLSCADWRLMPTARRISAHDAPAALAAATVLSSRFPAWAYSQDAASTPRSASEGAI